MPSLGKRGVSAWLALWIAGICGLLCGLGFWFFLPDARDGRELALALAAQSAAPSAGQGAVAVRGRGAPDDAYAAEALCRAVVGQDLQRADCRLGRVLDLQQRGSQDVETSLFSSALARAEKQLGLKVAQYTAIRDALIPALQGSNRSWLVGGLELRLARLTAVQSQPSISYSELFDVLLLAEGLRYDSFSGRFSAQRWDVARLLDTSGQIRVRAEHLQQVLRWLPVVIGLAVFVLVFSCLVWVGWMAGLVALLFSMVAGLGLLIVADASLRFGQGSPVYLLNPFSYALERQAWVVVGGLLLPAVFLFTAQGLAHRLPPLASASRRWLPVILGFPMVATALAYGLMGPAAGSEALKLTACLFGGLVTTWFARQTYLARKVVPTIFSLRSFWASLSEILSGQTPPSPQRFLHTSFFRAYLGLFVLGLLTVAAAALVFSDFGGTLVSGLVFVALVFILFGLRLALVFLLAATFAGAIALLTEKVQARVQLMLDPMTASVSDFARLIKFSEAGQPSGYGLGSIRWCSFEGACLPIQALSDYFPVLLSGALGLAGAALVFLVLVGLYIGLMARAMIGFASGLGPVSLLFATAFFLLLAALSQTVITYFGNWRLAPLTGLGLPLMSMGWSSMVSVVLGLTLLAVALSLGRSPRGLSGARGR